MKKYYFKKIYKIIGFIFTNLIIYGIIIGVICGLIVTFLFYTPKICLTNTYVTIKDKKINFEFVYENKGQSSANNIEYSTQYIILNGNEEICNSPPINKQEKFEVGDVIKDSFWIDLKKTRNDIFENCQIIILRKVKYEDSSKFRKCINEILLNNKYSISRLTFYDVSKKEKNLSLLTIEERNKFKDIIDKWINE